MRVPKTLELPKHHISREIEGLLGFINEELRIVSNGELTLSDPLRKIYREHWEVKDLLFIYYNVHINIVWSYHDRPNPYSWIVTRLPQNHEGDYDENDEQNIFMTDEMFSSEHDALNAAFLWVLKNLPFNSLLIKP